MYVDSGNTLTTTKSGVVSLRCANGHLFIIHRPKDDHIAA